MVERKKTLELKKHVAAIHSNNKLSLLQRKIANALLFNAYDHLLEKDEHEIHIPTLCKLIGYDSNDHKTIKKSLVNLLATVIEWNLVDGNKIDSEGIWNASSMIADASIDGAKCTYSYSNKMKKLLHRPELYGRLNMLVQAKFQSTYGLALYENCIRYQNIAQTPWFDIVQFRKLMGIEEGKYKVFRDFKNRVLNKAVAEVNEFSPILITPNFQKQGRQVIAIQFSIKSTKIEKADRSLNDKGISLSTVLRERFGLSHPQIEDVLSTYEESYILEKIAIVESSPSYSKGTIQNLAKYLISAMKDNYQSVKSTKANRNRHKENIPKNNPCTDMDYSRFVDKEIIKKLNRMRGRNKVILLSDFEKYILKGLYYELYRREGLKNILVQDEFCRYIKEKNSSFIGKVVPYSEFLASQEIAK